MSRVRPAATMLAVVTVLLLALGPGQRATAEPAIDIGWWTTSQLGGVPIGQAATVPDGGSQVASGANGPTSIAAVRFAAADGTTTEYRVALESASTPDTAAVAACPVTSEWSPVRAGTFDDAPTWDCSIAQTSQAYDPTSNTVSWTFGPEFVRGGVVDVMLLPTAEGFPFTITMAPPTDDAVRVESAPSPTTTTAPTTIAPTTSEVPATSISSAPTRPAPTVAPSPTFAPVTAPPPVPTTRAPTASAPAGLASPLPTTTPVAVTASTAGGASGPGRVVGVAALALVVAAGVALARGGMGLAILTEPDGARGVGRFRHVRDEPPIDI